MSDGLHCHYCRHAPCECPDDSTPAVVEPEPDPIEYLEPDPPRPLLDRREKPPARRHLETRKVELFQRSYHLSVGRYPDGRPCEVFGRGAKAGSEMDALLDDACILVSVLLQLGASLDALGELFARDGESVVGALVRELQAEPLEWPPGEGV